MVFKSKYAAFRVNVRPKIEVMHPTLPRVLETIEPLVAEFGKHGGEGTVVTPDGSMMKVADIRGHFYDTVEEQDVNSWTDDERDEVEEALLKLCQKWPAAIQLVDTPRAALPWPTYDDTPRDQIVALAMATGRVAEALAYESENGKRSTVTGPLEKQLAQDADDKAAEEALVAV